MGPAESQGGFPVLPDPAPGAPRSQMSLADSDHGTCLSSWEEGAGFVLGTGCEVMKRLSLYSVCSRRRVCGCHFVPRGGQFGVPPHPLPSPSCGSGLVSDLAGNCCMQQRGPLPVSPLPPCLGQVNRMAQSHFPPLGSIYGESWRPDLAPLMVCELVEAAAAAHL